MAYQHGRQHTGHLVSQQTAFGCITQQWVNCAPVFLHQHQRVDETNTTLFL